MVLWEQLVTASMKVVGSCSTAGTAQRGRAQHVIEVAPTWLPVYVSMPWSTNGHGTNVRDCQVAMQAHEKMLVLAPSRRQLHIQPVHGLMYVHVCLSSQPGDSNAACEPHAKHVNSNVHV